MTDTMKPLNGGVLLDMYDDGQIGIMLGNFKLETIDDTQLNSKAHLGTDGKNRHGGMRPRWGIVLAVSEEAAEEGLAVGDKVLAEFGEWTPKFKFGGRWVWWIKNAKIIGVDDAGPTKIEREHIARRNKVSA